MNLRHMLSSTRKPISWLKWLVMPNILFFFFKDADEMNTFLSLLVNFDPVGIKNIAIIRIATAIWIGAIRAGLVFKRCCKKSVSSQDNK